MKRVLLIGLVLVSLFKLQAQNGDKSFITNIPGDSLMFMVYYNQESVGNDSLFNEVKKEFADVFEGLMESCQEICFYGQNKDVYDCYTINFRSEGSINPEKAKVLLEEMDFEVVGFTGQAMRLKGGPYRHGYLYMGKDFSTLKIFTQVNPIKHDLRKKHEELLSQLMSLREYDDYELRGSIHLQMDSIAALDSIDSKIYFDNLIHSYQQRIDRGEDIQQVASPFKYSAHQKAIIKDKVFVMYLRPQYLDGVAYHLLRAFNKSMGYDETEMLKSMNVSLKMYDHVWVGASLSDQEISIDVVGENDKAKSQFYKKLDKELMTFLPDTVPTILGIYHADVTMIKEHLLKHFAFHEMDDEERAAVKLGLLAIDDEVLSTVGNAFVTVNGDLDGYDMPDFKVAFKMPNGTKGRILMDVLCDDLKLFYRVDKNTYLAREADREIRLCIVDDVWIIGTGSVDNLKHQLTFKEVQQRYPNVVDKGIVQYITFGDVDREKGYGYDHIVLKSKHLNKKCVKTSITIDRNWLQSNM